MNFDPSSMGEQQYTDYPSAPVGSVVPGSSSRFEPESDPEPRWWWLAARWRENHGNLLLVMTGLILLVGSAILAYQQNRMRPLSFPDSRTLQSGRAMLEAEAADPVNSMEIRVLGATDATQPVRVAFYDHPDDFNDVSAAFMKQTIMVNPDDMVASVLIPIEQLPPQFAIAAYHDTDGNGELSRNAFKIPAEVYGFSNQARGQFGPPKYSDAVIERPSVGTTIEIHLH